MTALTVYLTPTSTAGQQVIEGIIYSDALGKPEALLGMSEQLTFTSAMPAGWYDLPFPAPIKLSPGNYWIGVLTAASSHVAGSRYESVSGSRHYNANPFGSGASRGTTNPLVRRQVETATAVNIEHGPNDGGFTGGTGNWSLSNLFTYIDEVHALGRGVKLAGSPSEPAEMEYNLAAYFLISTGRDFVSGGGASQTVSSFWAAGR